MKLIGDRTNRAAGTLLGYAGDDALAGPHESAAPERQEDAPTATVPPATPARLRAIAAEVGVSDEQLAEAVLDVFHWKASKTHAAVDEENERLHDEADQLASGVNGGGRGEQLAFLFEGCSGVSAFRDFLLEISA